MENHEITPAERLDATLAIGAMRAQSRLWKAAEGRFSWREAFLLIVPAVLVSVGIEQLFWGTDAFSEYSAGLSGAGRIFLGLALFASFMWNHTQRRLNALLELVKRLEKGRV